MQSGGENNIQKACVAQGVFKDRVDACVGYIRRETANGLKEKKQCSADKDCFEIVDRANSSPHPSKEWNTQFNSAARRFRCQGRLLPEIVPMVDTTIKVEVKKDGRAVHAIVGRARLTAGSGKDIRVASRFCHTVVAVIQESSGQPETRITVGTIAHIGRIWNGKYMASQEVLSLPWYPDIARYEIWGREDSPAEGCPGPEYGLWSSKEAESFGVKPLVTINVAEVGYKTCEEKVGDINYRCFCALLEERAEKGIKILTEGENFSTIKEKALDAARNQK